jgi:16S rRNA (guanine(966)-N(2))-methyltransferase RsmD
MPKKPQTQLQFQVIAGELKGRKIVVPDLGVTRPPLTRLRKSIFDYLTPYLTGAHYLDLFSGTGSYLFEAVSRGAAEVLGVELEARLAEAINNQARKYDVSDRLKCECADVFEAVPRLASKTKRFEIIMIAPPQYKGFIDRTLAALAQHPLLSPGGQIVCQHDTSETDKIDWGDLPVTQRRKYGNTTYTILGGSDNRT